MPGFFFAVERRTMEPRLHRRLIDTVLFDFGGVLAEEGFRDGLAAIGRRSALAEEDVVRMGHELVLATGYVTGHARESLWWDALRTEAGIGGEDESLRREILERFVIRPRMIELNDRLRRGGIAVGILSDQTNWLDEIDERFGLYGRFDYIFNSFHMGKTKNDPAHFDDVLTLLNREAPQVLFVDDNAGHVGRARGRGWNALLFRDEAGVMAALTAFLRGVPDGPGD